MATSNSTPYSEGPHDTLTSRLMQVSAMVDCLNVSVTATDGAIEVSPKILSEAMWGISTLLSQARRAWETIQEEDWAASPIHSNPS